MILELKGIKMDSVIKRVLVTVVVFLVIFYLSPFLIKLDFYDIRVEVARLFISVHGAGMYWIGSKDDDKA